ncbi:DJ-1/PfpI family protein (plasmid) [Streptomyces sp. NBC_01387]|uniref:DJ-1/PfpI family protein n=1 Tax=unclassified Streptomyces TaxID=2593676 RepID=UPI0020258E37|nr:MULTISPECIES: DJ-1/PfpI family protein [unclassified Streptomyces]WSV59004.1 DJ-1/PfpI family protein [Streptomyces sp. NBC_01014]
MADVPSRDGVLSGRKIAILTESDFYEPEIAYYQRRFAEEGAQVDFVTRMWGNKSITFTGHEYRAPLTVTRSLEDLNDRRLREYSALIVPSGMVADRLRYTEDVEQLAPATDLLRRAFARSGVVKGIICHGMWLASSIPYVVRGRKVVCHNNLLGDVRNMGAHYVDQDVVVDGDLVTARTGDHCHLFARTIIDELVLRGV